MISSYDIRIKTFILKFTINLPLLCNVYDINFFIGVSGFRI